MLQSVTNIRQIVTYLRNNFSKSPIDIFYHICIQVVTQIIPLIDFKSCWSPSFLEEHIKLIAAASNQKTFSDQLAEASI